MGGGFHEMLLLSAKHSRSPYERRFGEPFKGRTIPFGSMVEYHPMHQFGKKVLPGIFFGIFSRGPSVKETSWSKTLRNSMLGDSMHRMC